MLGINPAACGDIPLYLYSDTFDMKDRCHYVPYGMMRKRLEFTDKTIRRIADHNSRVLPIFLSEVFCDNASQSCAIFDDAVLLYKDHHHLNPFGAMFIAKSVEDKFAQFMLSD